MYGEKRIFKGMALAFFMCLLESQGGLDVLYGLP